MRRRDGDAAGLDILQLKIVRVRGCVVKCEENVPVIIKKGSAVDDDQIVPWISQPPYLDVGVGRLI